jgi:tripartite-type tricarboxylate transporter receptor subunit TctC
LKRTLLSIAATVVALGTHSAFAQSYPTKPIRIVVPFPPGGGSDVIARVAAQKLTEAMGQQMIVDNRAGGGGTVGAEVGARAPPDGYTLMLIAPSYTVGPSLYKLSFDAANDITAIIQLSQGAFILAVHPSLPVKTVNDLLALAKARPDELSYASAGAGSGIHLAMALFLDRAGVKILHVPYKGNGPALTDTIAGNVQMLMSSAPSIMPHVRNGRLRALAVSTAQRSPTAPDLPTVAEAGIKDFDVTLWHGLIGPKGVPATIVSRLNGELNKTLRTKAMVDRLAADGVVPAGGTPEQFATIIRRDIEMWGNVIRKAGIKAD